MDQCVDTQTTSYIPPVEVDISSSNNLPLTTNLDASLGTSDTPVHLPVSQDSSISTSPRSIESKKMASSPNPQDDASVMNTMCIVDSAITQQNPSTVSINHPSSEQAQSSISLYSNSIRPARPTHPPRPSSSLPVLPSPPIPIKSKDQTLASTSVIINPSTSSFMPSSSIPFIESGHASLHVKPLETSDGQSARTEMKTPTGPDKSKMKLPKVSFSVVEDDYETYRIPQEALALRNFGFRDGSEWVKPEHYISHLEPIEADLKNQIEYDVDVADIQWVEAFNEERRKANTDPISVPLFEVVIDRLEKEWWDLTKNLPNARNSAPVEDAPCAICDDMEGENSNAIVFCDGCNLAVHQDCYGVPYIPEGQWLCRKCTVSPEHPVSCVLCPTEGGAFKQTSAGHWAHLLCAIWVPEAGVGNAVWMEPIDGIEGISRQRWKLNCSLCRLKIGACIQCENKNCFTAFHVTCAREAGFLGSMKTYGGGDDFGGVSSGSSGGILRAWCEKHAPARLLESNAQKLALYPKASSSKTKKSAQAHANKYRPPAPRVPAKIRDDVLSYVSKVSLRKKKEAVESIVRYWCLKRESRRGAPLLKRLHMEPWTAADLARQETDIEKAQRHEYLSRLRNDLESARFLCEMVRKREKEKIKQSEILRDVIYSILFSQEEPLKMFVKKLKSQDRSRFFEVLVSKAEVPDYYDIIKAPMAFEVIERKIEEHAYRNFQEIKDDISLIFDNAVLYNPPVSPIHKLAIRLRKHAEKLLVDLQTELVSILGPSVLSIPLHPTMVGNLDPPIEVLQLFNSKDSDETRSLNQLFQFIVERTPSPSPPPEPPSVLPELEVNHEMAEKPKRKKQKVMPMARQSSRRNRTSHVTFLPGSNSSGIPDPPLCPTDVAGSAAAAADGGGDDGDETGAVKPAVTPVSKKGHRKPATVIGQTMDLPVINPDDLDNKSTFSNFETGWILPAGSSRKRKATGSRTGLSSIVSAAEGAEKKVASTRPRKGQAAFSKTKTSNGGTEIIKGSPSSNSRSIQSPTKFSTHSSSHTPPISSPLKARSAIQPSSTFISTPMPTLTSNEPAISLFENNDSELSDLSSDNESSQMEVVDKLEELDDRMDIDQDEGQETGTNETTAGKEKEETEYDDQPIKPTESKTPKSPGETGSRKQGDLELSPKLQSSRLPSLSTDSVSMSDEMETQIEAESASGSDGELKSVSGFDDQSVPQDTISKTHSIMNGQRRSARGASHQSSAANEAPTVGSISSSHSLSLQTSSNPASRPTRSTRQRSSLALPTFSTPAAPEGERFTSSGRKVSGGAMDVIKPNPSYLEGQVTASQTRSVRATRESSDASEFAGTGKLPSEEKSELQGGSDFQTDPKPKSKSEQDRKAPRKSISRSKNKTARIPPRPDLRPDFEHGELVWARVPGYQLYPSHLIILEEIDPEDPDEDQIPTSVVNARPKTNVVHLVRFYDAQMSFGWAQPNDLYKLGEDKEFDKLLVTARTVAAYNRAMENIEVPPETGTDETAGEKGADGEENQKTEAVEIEERGGVKIPLGRSADQEDEDRNMEVDETVRGDNTVVSNDAHGRARSQGSRGQRESRRLTEATSPDESEIKLTSQPLTPLNPDSPYPSSVGSPIDSKETTKASRVGLESRRRSSRRLNV